MTTPPERTCMNPSCRCRFVNQKAPARGRSRTRATYRGNHGYCPRCYRRWADHGYPDSGPPAPQRAGRRPGGTARIEDYAELRSLTRAEAALRLGVTRRTIGRYEAALRALEAA